MLFLVETLNGFVMLYAMVEMYRGTLYTVSNSRRWYSTWSQHLRFQQVLLLVIYKP